MSDEDEDDYYGDIYHNPKKYGLELLWSQDTGESYEFDITAIWREIKTGKFFIGHDSGCSCPSPFEDQRDMSGLEEITVANCNNILTQIRAATDMNVLDQIELIEHIRELMEKSQCTDGKEKPEI